MLQCKSDTEKVEIPPRDSRGEQEIFPQIKHSDDQISLQVTDRAAEIQPAKEEQKKLIKIKIKKLKNIRKQYSKSCMFEIFGDICHFNKGNNKV